MTLTLDSGARALRAAVMNGELYPGEVCAADDACARPAIARMLLGYATYGVCAGHMPPDRYGVMADGIDTGTRFVSACTMCAAPTVFAVVSAPDCNMTAQLGCNGARSDAYGIYCTDCTPLYCVIR